MLMKKLQAIIEPVVSQLGYEFVGFELLSQGRGHLVRIYIDGKNGVDIEACAKVSRQLSSVFDVEDPFSGAYFLEVSSPGIDRPLFTLSHYQRFVGHRIKIRTRIPDANNRRRFTGQLVSVEQEIIKLKMDDNDQLIEFSFEEIEKANIIAD